MKFFVMTTSTSPVEPDADNTTPTPTTTTTVKTSLTSSVSSSNSSTSTTSSTTCRKNIVNDVLVGLVISKWDNILGPQCIYLWTEETTSCFNPISLSPRLECLVKYVTDHTVDHHDIIVDGHLLTPSTCRHTLCFVHELNLAYISLSIRVPSDANYFSSSSNYNGGGASSIGESSFYSGDTTNSCPTVPHAVSVLVNLNLLSEFLLMRPVITNWLAEFGPKLSILLCKNRLQSSMINSWCAELCKTMATIRTCWNQEDKQLSTNFFGEAVIDKNEAASSKACSKSNSDIASKEPRSSHKAQRRKPRNSIEDSQSDWEFLLPPWPNRTIFESLLTSHLSTSGSTLVVGNDIQNINQVIRFLLCFSKGDEGYCSKYVHPSLPDTFMKGLFVQGLVSGEIGERSVSLYHVSSNRYPVTHIELKYKSTYKIRQSPHINLHRQRRETILTQELVSLWNFVPFVHPVLEPFPKTVRDVAAKFISKFLNDLLLLEPNQRYSRLILFKISLQTKAMALITYLNSFSHKPAKEKNQLSKDYKDLMRYDENEYVIVQMVAEKLRPGVLQRLKYS